MASLGSALVRLMDRIDNFIVLVGQVLLSAMVAVTFVSVIGRTFFSQPLPDDVMFSEMMMVAVVFLPLSYVQWQGAHLEVTVLTDFFPEKVQSVLVSCGLVLGIIMFGLTAYYSAIAAYDSFQFGVTAYASTLDLPEWPVKALIPIGLIWWCMRMLTHLVAPRTRRAHQSEYDEALKAADESDPLSR